MTIVRSVLEPKALEFEGVCHRFGARVALDDVSFAIDAGAFAVLLGPNGAGKTTLFSLATRLYHARTGDIRVFGRLVRDEPYAALALMGVVFQDPTLDLDLTVRENLRYQAALYGLPRAEADARGEAELARLGVAGRLDDKVRALSGGLRRRVEVARALLHGPRLLLLDEPTVGLDLATRRALLAHVRALCAERGIASLWATHLMDEVEDEDPVVLLHEGRVLRAGRAAELRGEATLAEAFLALTGATLADEAA
jgi:ABC-2 type transport system ATP-binding protein